MDGRGPGVGRETIIKDGIGAVDAPILGWRREGSSEGQGQGTRAATFAQRGLIRIRYALVHPRNKRRCRGMRLQIITVPVTP